MCAGAAGGDEVQGFRIGHIWDNGNGGGAARDDGTGRR